MARANEEWFPGKIKTYTTQHCKSSAKSLTWFQTSWFTHGLALEKGLNFIDLNDRNQQLINRTNEGVSKFNLGDGLKQVA
ncbi:MAG: hypothetical protein KKG99_15465 [Bacteroidetes bacterium]|nr:hypothetical protein [Bacteroidota bacterium]